MRSYILHGENLPSLHQRLIQLLDQAQKEGFEIIRLDWKKITEKDLRLTGRSQSLLGGGQCLVVDNFFTNNKKAIEIIASLPREEVIYIFSDTKSLTPTQTKVLSGKYVVQEFPIPKTIFNFLNSVFPGNNKQMVSLFNQSKDAEEFIFIMLARHIKQLIWAAEDPETLKLADWQKQRLAGQAKKFTTDKLRNLHTKLLKIERQQKKSQLPEDLHSSLELLLLSI